MSVNVCYFLSLKALAFSLCSVLIVRVPLSGDLSRGQASTVAGKVQEGLVHPASVQDSLPSRSHNRAIEGNRYSSGVTGV